MGGVSLPTPGEPEEHLYFVGQFATAFLCLLFCFVFYFIESKVLGWIKPAVCAWVHTTISQHIPEQQSI